MSEAKKLGAHVNTQESVIDWNIGNDSKIFVTTNKNQYKCSKLIFTCGSWSSKLIDVLNNKKVLTVERQVTGWFEAKVKLEF